MLLLIVAKQEQFLDLTIEGLNYTELAKKLRISVALDLPVDYKSYDCLLIKPENPLDKEFIEIFSKIKIPSIIVCENLTILPRELMNNSKLFFLQQPMSLEKLTDILENIINTYKISNYPYVTFNNYHNNNTNNTQNEDIKQYNLKLNDLVSEIKNMKDWFINFDRKEKIIQEEKQLNNQFPAFSQREEKENIIIESQTETAANYKLSNVERDVNSNQVFIENFSLKIEEKHFLERKYLQEDLSKHLSKKLTHSQETRVFDQIFLLVELINFHFRTLQGKKEEIDLYFEVHRFFNPGKIHYTIQVEKKDKWNYEEIFFLLNNYNHTPRLNSSRSKISLSGQVNLV